MAKLEAGSGNTKFIELRGKVFYAQTNKPSKEGAWTLEIVPDAGEDRTIAEASGLPQMKISQEKGGGLKSYKEAPGPVYRFKRGLVNKQTNQVRTPPKVLDSQGNEVQVSIGNGSTVVVRGTVYPYTYLGKSGITASFHEVQIADLVESTNTKSHVIQGSFVANSTQLKTSEDETIEVESDIDEDLSTLEEVLTPKSE